VGAIRYLRSEEAVGRIALVGASMGGTASLVAAAQPGTDVSAVVTLSAPSEIEGLRVDGTLLSSITAGKLFIAGVGDAPAAAAAQTLYEQAPPPKRVEIVPADDHGTDLLSGAQAEVVRRLIEVALETNRV
jgi:dienelactone hydrolase